MKQRLSTPVLAIILVLTAGFVFPLIFSVTDKLLRELLIFLDPFVLRLFSFIWLLLFYYFGIKFSLEYLLEHFEVKHKQKLFQYSNIGFSLVTLLLYASLITASMLSNLVWGFFYLSCIGMFYYLSSKHFA